MRQKQKSFVTTKKRINLEDSFREKAHYVCYRIRGTLQCLDEIRFLKKYE